MPDSYMANQGIPSRTLNSQMAGALGRRLNKEPRYRVHAVFVQATASSLSRYFQRTWRRPPVAWSRPLSCNISLTSTHVHHNSFVASSTVFPPALALSNVSFTISTVTLEFSTADLTPSAAAVTTPAFSGPL